MPARCPDVLKIAAATSSETHSKYWSEPSEINSVLGLPRSLAKEVKYDVAHVWMMRLSAFTKSTHSHWVERQSSHTVGNRSIVATSTSTGHTTSRDQMSTRAIGGACASHANGLTLEAWL